MRLLVAEGDARGVGPLRRDLTDEGYVVDTAVDGRDALWLAREHPYDAAVLDAALPGLDGFEVCRRLRESGRYTPVLLLTARGTGAERSRGLAAGVDDLLVRPFAFGALAARVAALVRTGGPAWRAPLVHGDLVLDPAARTADREGARLDLTRTEFALLELFMRHPGEVLTRDRIIAHLRPVRPGRPPARRGERVVNQHVGFLRRKLGGDDLQTVGGDGYRLRPAREELSAQASELSAQASGLSAQVGASGSGMRRLTVPRRSSQAASGPRTRRSTTASQPGQRATSPGACR
jgi:two-component system OmpR family response regulator